MTEYYIEKNLVYLHSFLKNLKLRHELPKFEGSKDNIKKLGAGLVAQW